MKQPFNVRTLSLPNSELTSLAAEASKEGFDFVDRLIADGETGANRFIEPGEKLIGVFQEDDLVAVGGLNRDPYLVEDSVGRIRHLYVHPLYRRRGIAELLVSTLLEDARPRFDRVRLRTASVDGDHFYEALGFKPTDEDDATHEFRF